LRGTYIVANFDRVTRFLMIRRIEFEIPVPIASRIRRENLYSSLRGANSGDDIGLPVAGWI